MLGTCYQGFVKILSILLLCSLVSAQTVRGDIYTISHPEIRASKKSWVRRHPLLLEGIGLSVAAGIFFYKTWPQRCPSDVDGYPYNGTPPCPKSCESDGCYWPKKK